MAKDNFARVASRLFRVSLLGLGFLTTAIAGPALMAAHAEDRSSFSFTIRYDDDDDRSESSGWGRGRDHWDRRGFEQRGRWDQRGWDQRGWQQRDWSRNDWNRSYDQQGRFWCPSTRRWIAFGAPGYQPPPRCHFVNRQIWQHGRLVTWQERVCY
jgi:hypothetical protein